MLVVNQIYWCEEVEAAFAAMQDGDKDGMKKYSEVQAGAYTRSRSRST